MKSALPQLRLGALVNGRIVEVLAEPRRDGFHGELLISFDGSLLRVINESGRSLAVGQVVSLKVVETKPLKFRLSDENRVSKRQNGHIDFTI